MTAGSDIHVCLSDSEQVLLITENTETRLELAGVAAIQDSEYTQPAVFDIRAKSEDMRQSK